jgi:aerobic carbon-monoxide dehydrogenase medium subunit
LRSDVLSPELVVDIKKIAETRTITEEKGGFRVGAAVTGAELKEHAKLKKAWPGLVEAANLIGSTQVQGRATMGGNLCNGSPAADSVPALIAAGAIATIVGPSGRRELAVEDIMLAPRKLALAKGELIASFLLPARGKGMSDAYLRFIPRTEMDIAVVGVGVNLTVDASGKITAARAEETRGRRSCRLHADRRQAWNQGVPHRSRRCTRAARRTHRARPRQESLR